MERLCTLHRGGLTEEVRLKSVDQGKPGNRVDLCLLVFPLCAHADRESGLRPKYWQLL